MLLTNVANRLLLKRARCDVKRRKNETEMIKPRCDMALRLGASHGSSDALGIPRTGKRGPEKGDGKGDGGN